MKIVLVILLTVLLRINALSQESYISRKDTFRIEEILIESNRLKMTNADSPNKIQLLDSKYISALNGNRLSDLLEQSGSVFIKDYGFNSGSKIISLNATQSEHTLVLLDGIKLNSRQNAQVDLSLYDLDNISKVEISSGGSSALYGSEAVGGIVSINTRSFDSSKPIEVKLKSDFGSYGMRKYYGRLSQSFRLGTGKSFSYDLSYSDERAQNNFRYYFKDGMDKTLKERGNSDYSTQAFNFGTRISVGKNSAVKLFTLYSHFERGVPGIETGYAAGTARQIDYNSVSSVVFTKMLSSKIEFRMDLNYKYSLQKYFDPATFNLAVKINSFYKLNSYANNTAVEIASGNEFNLAAGYEISYNSIYSNDTEEGSAVQAALFGSAKCRLNQKIVPEIMLYPSLRYDYFSNIDRKNVLTGKLGINIRPFSRNDIRIKSSFGNNFGAPTFNELYWKDIGNPKLKPERSICFDAGLVYSFNFLLDNQFEASYFNINTSNRIVWVPASGSIWHPVNIGKVKSEGIDLSVKSALRFHEKMIASISLNYNYSRAIKKNEDYPGDLSFNKQMIYLPEVMFKSSLMLNYLTTSKSIKYVSFNVFYRYTSRRYTDFENSEYAPRYDILDCNAGAGFDFSGIQMSVKFIINNILDENYQVIEGYPMPLRNYKFEIGFKY